MITSNRKLGLTAENVATRLGHVTTLGSAQSAPFARWLSLFLPRRFRSTFVQINQPKCSTRHLLTSLLSSPSPIAITLRRGPFLDVVLARSAGRFEATPATKSSRQWLRRRCPARRAGRVGGHVARASGEEEQELGLVRRSFVSESSWPGWVCEL